MNSMNKLVLDEVDLNLEITMIIIKALRDIHNQIADLEKDTKRIKEKLKGYDK